MSKRGDSSLDDGLDGAKPVGKLFQFGNVVLKRETQEEEATESFLLSIPGIVIVQVCARVDISSGLWTIIFDKLAADQLLDSLSPSDRAILKQKLGISQEIQ